jgi:hypothetical protein
VPVPDKRQPAGALPWSVLVAIAVILALAVLTPVLVGVLGGSL